MRHRVEHPRRLQIPPGDWGIWIATALDGVTQFSEEAVLDALTGLPSGKGEATCAELTL